MEDLKKEFVPYQEALELKELGFDEPCIATHGYLELYINTDDGHVKAPTFSQAFRWFREKYNIQSSVKFTHAKYSFEIYFEKLANGENPPVMVWHLIDSWLGLNLDLFETYEEAELACLRHLIEIGAQEWFNRQLDKDKK